MSLDDRSTTPGPHHSVTEFSKFNYSLQVFVWNLSTLQVMEVPLLREGAIRLAPAAAPTDPAGT